MSTEHCAAPLHLLSRRQQLLGERRSSFSSTSGRWTSPADVSCLARCFGAKTSEQKLVLEKLKRVRLTLRDSFSNRRSDGVSPSQAWSGSYWPNVGRKPKMPMKRGRMDEALGVRPTAASMCLSSNVGDMCVALWIRLLAGILRKDPQGRRPPPPHLAARPSLLT